MNPYELDAFTLGYISCALWAESAQSDEFPDETASFESSGYGLDDIDPETMQQMIEDCEQFQRLNESDLRAFYDLYNPAPGYSVEECAGHDFWLTRNGHGAGFWDRGLGKLGDRLTKACKTYEEYYFYLGDDGRIHGS